MVEKRNQKHQITKQFYAKCKTSGRDKKCTHTHETLKIELKKGIELSGETIYNFFGARNCHRVGAETKTTAHIWKFFRFSHNYHLLNNNNSLILIYYSLFNIQSLLFMQHPSCPNCTVYTAHNKYAHAFCCTRFATILQLLRNGMTTIEADGCVRVCVSTQK